MPSDSAGEESETPREDMVAFVELLYRAAYRLDDGFNPGGISYEYAVQNLCSELAMMGEVSEDESTRAMQAAQEHIHGEARGEDSRPLSEFGVVLSE